MFLFVNKIQSLKYEITCLISRSVINFSELREIKKLKKKIKIDGFRKGNAINSLVKEKYGDNIYYDVIETLLKSKILIFLKDKNILPIEFPLINNIFIDDNYNLKIFFTYEVYPDIKLVEFNKLCIEKPIIKVLESDVKETLNKIKEKQWNPILNNEKSNIGDKLDLNIITTDNNNKTLNEYTFDNIRIILGEYNLIDKLDDFLVGKKINDIINIKLEHKKILLKFKIKIKNILRTLHDDTKYTKELIYNDLKKYSKNIEEKKIKDNLLNALLDNHNFDIPEMLIDKEKKVLLEEFKNKDYEFLNKESKKRAMVNLLFHKIIITFHIQPKEDMIQSKFIEIKELFKDNLQIDHDKLFQLSKNIILVDEVLNFVKQNVKLVKKEIFLSDVIKLNNDLEGIK